MKTQQIEFWEGDFGKDYTDRNYFSREEWDDYYLKQYGITKLEMNKDFISNLPKDAKILEVGSNVGMQLRGLMDQGFNNLYGIEIQKDAVIKSKNIVEGVNVIQGNGFDLPFKDGYFDIVVTNGVLIHIHPRDHARIMSEIYRCSAKYIWGFEYYSEEITDINYRGNTGFLWKADFAKIYLENFEDLKMMKSQKYPYKNNVEKGNVDEMFLLAKSE